MPYLVTVHFEIPAEDLSEAREWMRSMVELSEDTGFLTTALVKDGRVVGHVRVERMA